MAFALKFLSSRAHNSLVAREGVGTDVMSGSLALGADVVRNGILTELSSTSARRSEAIEER
jgi:hypothetical protein